MNSMRVSNSTIEGDTFYVPRSLPGNGLALAEFHIRFTQFGDYLIHCVTFLRHCESPFRALSPIKILSLTMVQFYGGGQCAKAAWIYPKVAAGDGLLRPTDQQV